MYTEIGLDPNITKLHNRILVIDDEPNLRRTLSLILQRSGYEVSSASNAEEARQSLKECDYNLIFLDLKMPDINGLDLLPEIREGHPDTPVLILTAHATLESAIDAVRKGARDYLLKPIDPEQIIERVHQLLDEQKQPKRRKEIVLGIKGLLSELSQLEGFTEQTGIAKPAGAQFDPERFVQRGHITLDIQTRQTYISGRYIQLSPTAFDYLATLLRYSPDVVECEKLVKEAQGIETSPVEAKEIARWRIHELRKAIEPDPRRPRFIITARGTGYRLVL
jgi:DNA-binding response OmpR family regulator